MICLAASAMNADGAESLAKLYPTWTTGRALSNTGTRAASYKSWQQTVLHDRVLATMLTDPATQQIHWRQRACPTVGLLAAKQAKTRFLA